ncbi:DNA-binding protein [Nocardia goodfellowii]
MDGSLEQPDVGETMTHSLEYAVERIGAPSVDWLARRLSAREFPARRVGRSWRMTDSDIAETIRRLAQPAIPVVQPDVPETAQLSNSIAAGLSRRSRLHLERKRYRRG